MLCKLLEAAVSTQHIAPMIGAPACEECSLLDHTLHHRWQSGPGAAACFAPDARKRTKCGATGFSPLKKAAAGSAAAQHALTCAAYQDFLTLWKDADPDIPILKQAKAEYAKPK